MSKQFQLRRGTTEDNESFTGAEGELTLDTDTKQIHIHDGETAGGVTVDYVVETQLPTIDNNYKWYRKYASGWVEQGGYFGTSTGSWANATITFPIIMSNVNYMLWAQGNWSEPGSSSCQVTQKTTRGATIRYANNTTGVQLSVWQVSGMAA